MTFWETLLYPALQEIANDLLTIVPNFLAALILLIVGWILARIAGGILRRLLAKVGFDRLADRAGISGLLNSAGLAHDASWLVGRLVFWLMMLMFFLSAAEQLHLTAIVVTLQQLVAFMPNVIAVVVIGVLGALFGRFVGGLVRGAATEANIAFADVLGRLANGLVLVIVIVTAFMQLEIESGMLEITFAVILGAFGLGVALMVGLGSREIAHHILSGLYARRTFQTGQRVRVRDMEGDIVSIGTVNAVLRVSDGRMVTLPNAVLVHEIVEYSEVS